jgi:hypothetical protein
MAMYGMRDLVDDLVAVSRGACLVDRATRDVAWALLKRLAAEGVHEAQLALCELNRAGKRRSNPRRATATIGDALKIKRKGQGK